MNLLRNCCTALQNTLKHVCTTAERIKNQVVDFVKNVDWKKVAIVAAATVAAVAVSVATAGAAAPVVAGLVGSVGLTGFGAAVATGVGVGVIAGAAGGGTQALVSGALSGKDGKTILKDTWEGIKGGAVTGAFTGGLTAGLGAASSSVTNGLVRHGVDTVGETVIDTISDAAQGGQITPTSIGTSLFLNAVTEGVSSRTVRAPKADVVTTKPKSGDVPVTRPRKDVTPVQQLALPWPTSKPLALPAPSDKISQINPYNIRFSQSSVNGADSIQSSMISNGWKGDAIDVVNMPDGKLTTIDNTRVIAARGAGIAATARVQSSSRTIYR